MPPTTDFAALERLGDEIAELSAHLDAATARLLTLTRSLDELSELARGAPRPRLGDRRPTPHGESDVPRPAAGATPA